MSSRPIPETVWRSPSGEVVSCVEKLKVLRENLEEIRQICQDALEDAVLMGCDERQFRQILSRLMQQIENPYRDKSERSPQSRSARKTAQTESVTNAASVHSGMLNESSVQSTAPHSPEPRKTRFNPSSGPKVESR